MTWSKEKKEGVPMFLPVEEYSSDEYSSDEYSSDEEDSDEEFEEESAEFFIDLSGMFPFPVEEDNMNQLGAILKYAEDNGISLEEFVMIACMHNGTMDIRDGQVYFHGIPVHTNNI